MSFLRRTIRKRKQLSEKLLQEEVGAECGNVIGIVTALFNAIKRSKRMLPEIEKENEKKKSRSVYSLLFIE